MPVKLPQKNYTDAQLHCVARGGTLFAAKEPGEFEVAKEYAANNSKLDVYIIFSENGCQTKSLFSQSRAISGWAFAPTRSS